MSPRFVLLVSLIATVVAYRLVIRFWCRRWGTTAADLARPMCGDATIPHPNYEATLAVTVDARPEHIWPWLAQMGYQRGGLYSYDWLDRRFGYLDGPSATRILPQFQEVEVGDIIPIGRAAGFPVKAVIPNRALVLAAEMEGLRWTWEFGLYPLGDTRTRLVSRNRASMSGRLRFGPVMALLEPAAFVMTRRMLLGLKQRAETLARETTLAPSPQAYAEAASRR